MVTWTRLADRTGFRTADAFALSSSPAGTLYLSERTGGLRAYFRPAPFSSGAAEVDLGPVDPRARALPVLVAEQVATPVRGTHVGGIVAVDWWRSAAPFPSGRVVLRATESYVGSTGDGVVVFDTGGSRALRVRPFGGGADIAIGTLAFDPPPESLALAATHSPRGAVLSAFGDVLLLRYPDPANPVPGPEAGGSAHRAISASVVATGTLSSGTTIRRFDRAAPATATESFVEPESLQALAVGETGTAWTVQEPDLRNTLRTRPVGGATVAYARRLDGRDVCRFEDSDDFLVYDRGAPTPGFYRVSPGARAGTLVGVLGPADAVGLLVRLSHGRALHGDDSTPTLPLFLRDVSDLDEPGPEIAVAPRTRGPLGPAARWFDLTPQVADLGGPFLVYGRADPTPTLVVGHADGRPVARPWSEPPYRIEVSGLLALTSGAGSAALLDLLDGTHATLGTDHSRRLWGDHLLELRHADGEVRRTHLRTGATVVLHPGDPAQPPVDQPVLAQWGPHACWAFRVADGSVVHGLWTDGATAPLPGAGDVEAAELSDHLLLTLGTDGVRLRDLTSGATALLDTGARSGSLDVDGLRVAWIRTDGAAVVDDVTTHLPAYALGPALLVSTAPDASRMIVSRDVAWELTLAGIGPVAAGTSRFGEIVVDWDSVGVTGTFAWELTGTALDDGAPLVALLGETLTGEVALGTP